MRGFAFFIHSALIAYFPCKQMKAIRERRKRKMKIVKYSSRLDKDRMPVLVKERACIYMPGQEMDLNSPYRITALVNDVFHLADMTEEHMLLICLNSTAIRGVFDVASGSVSTVMTDISTLIRDTIMVGASNMIVVHNHPSGKISPSNDDKEMTQKLANACRLVGLFDHIIVGENGQYFSFAENSML